MWKNKSFSGVLTHFLPTAGKLIRAGLFTHDNEDSEAFVRSLEYLCPMVGTQYIFRGSMTIIR